MSKEKAKKTNAARMLDKNKVDYEFLTYDISEGFVNGMDAADLTGLSYDQTYKTLVTASQSGGYFVCVIPVDKHLNLKRAAKHFGEKKIDMLPSKMMRDVTGYIHGGCSPLGMKKLFPTAVDLRAGQQEKIAVSAGQLGMSLMVRVDDLLKVTGGQLADIADDEE